MIFEIFVPNNTLSSLLDDDIPNIKHCVLSFRGNDYLLVTSRDPTGSHTALTMFQTIGMNVDRGEINNNLPSTAIPERIIDALRKMHEDAYISEIYESIIDYVVRHREYRIGLGFSYITGMPVYDIEDALLYGSVGTAEVYIGSVVTNHNNLSKFDRFIINKFAYFGDKRVLENFFKFRGFNIETCGGDLKKVILNTPKLLALILVENEEKATDEYMQALSKDPESLAQYSQIAGPLPEFEHIIFKSKYASLFYALYGSKKPLPVEILNKCRNESLYQVYLRVYRDFSPNGR